MENKQTAMQIAFESYKNDGVSFTDWFSDNIDMLLKMEREQIMKANVDGYEEAQNYGETSSEQYYESKYGK